MPEVGPAFGGVYNNKGGSGAGEQAGHERAEKAAKPGIAGKPENEGLQYPDNTG